MAPKELRDELTKIMSDLSDAQGLALAAAVTDALNRRMAGIKEMPPAHSVDMEVWARCLNLLSSVEINLNTLDAGWRAWRAVHVPEVHEVIGQIISPQIVCSLPTHLRDEMRETVKKTGIVDGAILEQIAQMIAEAKEYVQIINPFWSNFGLQAILKRIKLSRLEGVHFEILTGAGLDGWQKDALKKFCDSLTAASMNVEVRFLDHVNEYDQQTAAHAKTILVDRRKAYLGSANLTGSGMNLSVELGIIFEGVLARKLSEWTESLFSKIPPET